MQDENDKKENTENEDLEFIESDEEGNVLPQKDIVKKLREENKRLRTERDEYLTGWQRAKADYINLQKELNDVRNTSSLVAKEKVILSILPALDSFDMAFSNKEAWQNVDENWRNGILYIYQQFEKSFEEIGVTKINEKDVLFDPKKHQPINTIDTNEKELDEKIANIIQIGYILGDRVIRPARVEVYKLTQ